MTIRTTATRRYVSLRNWLIVAALLVFVLVAAAVQPASTSASDALPTLNIVCDSGLSTGFETPFTLVSNGPTRVWGSRGGGVGQLFYPGGAAIASNGDLYVAERDNHRIQVFDPGGSTLNLWGSRGYRQSQFNYVNYVAMDRDDNLYATDHFNQRVQKFDRDGNFLLAWGWDVVEGNAETSFEVCTATDTCKSGSRGGGDGQFNEESGIAVYDDGTGTVYVYVAERWNHRVQKFTGDGTYLGKWGGYGSGPGQFNQAYGVAVDAAGNVYVADQFNHRIQKFDSNGSFLTQWGGYGSGDGRFYQPRGVAADGKGHIYVADSGNHRIQKFDTDGNFIKKWGNYGYGWGEFNYPWGIAAGDIGIVYLPDHRNHRMQKFYDVSLSLGDGESVTYTLDPASYDLTELVPEGWELTSIDCDGGSPQVDATTVGLTLAMGDDVTCTFTNVPPNQPPNADAGDTYFGEEGKTILLAGATASDPDGDQLSYDWSVDSSLCSFSDASVLNPTITCQDNGFFNVTLTVSDGVADAVSSSATVEVANVAPTIDSIVAPAAPVNILDQPVGVTVGYSDPGAADTHDVSWVWGDLDHDTQSTASNPATQSHTYSEAGAYSIEVTVTDDDGGSDTATYEYVVIYDPEGGFVTGGGWIMSPEGACPGCPESPEGKATFGFVSKYKKGASEPTGNTQFRFKAGGLNFHSTSYEWLVIAGANAKYKGEGTINGQGGYKFMLTATDGDMLGGGKADEFRIRIWDDNGLYYDNKGDFAEDEYGGTELGGGSIKIHKAK